MLRVAQTVNSHNYTCPWRTNDVEWALDRAEAVFGLGSAHDYRGYFLVLKNSREELSLWD